MRKFVMASRNSRLTNEGSSATLSGRSDPTAHQSECVHGNEPTPQTMIQLIGCRIEAKRQAGRPENLTAAENSSGPSTARAQR
jgi:hypothetical protein